MSLQPGPDDSPDDSALTPRPADAADEQPLPPVPPEAAGAPGTGDWEAGPAGPAPGEAAPPPPPAPGWGGPVPQAGPGQPGQAPGTTPPAPPGGQPGYGQAGQAWGTPPPPPPPRPTPDAWGTPPPPPPGVPGPEGWGAPPGYPSATPPAAEYPYGPAGAPGYGYPPGGYQAGPAPTGYGVPGYAPRQTDSKAVIALILSITSWVLCPILPAVVALILAGQSNRAIDASGGQLDGRSMNTATKWVSWGNIVVMGIGLVIGLVFMLLAIANSGITLDGSTEF
jgi:hypothetical protein